MAYSQSVVDYWLLRILSIYWGIRFKGTFTSSTNESREPSDRLPIFLLTIILLGHILRKIDRLTPPTNSVEIMKYVEVVFNLATSLLGLYIIVIGISQWSDLYGLKNPISFWERTVQRFDQNAGPLDQAIKTGFDFLQYWMLVIFHANSVQAACDMIGGRIAKKIIS